MTRRLAHRGPDGEGDYFARRLGLGHRRLAIIDMEGGGQPMVNEAGTLCLAANNEIYNYVELRRELEARGHRFDTASDTEVILKLFEEERERGLRKLEGMFALAVWDAADETLLLARDPFGIKPLYYYRDSSALVFASEMRALLEYPGLDRTLDLAALDGYFESLSLPEPRTVFRRVRKLPAGHFLKVHRGRVRIRSYWEPEAGAQPAGGPKPRVGNLARRFREELERTVALSLRSDVPVGLLLSGGVDSSSVAAFAARAGRGRLQTFSAAFSEGEFDESGFSRLVAKELGTRHHEVLVTKSRATRIASRLTELVDEPFADSSSIPTYAVCELASAHVKTVLSGEGADELLGGYPWHLPTPADGSPVSASGHPARVVFTEAERRSLYSGDLRRQIQRRRRNNPPGGGPGRGPAPHSLNASLLADIRGYLPSDILLKSDRMSMLHSLEVRVPFLNRRFAEFAMGLPEEMKVRGSVRKYLLKHAMRGLLPAAVLERPKKGFSIPMDLWLWERGAWREMVYDTIFSRRARARGQFDVKFLERLRHEHERLERLNGYKLWTVYVFEAWQRAFLD